MTEFLINMDDGRLVWRNEETDKHVNLKPISNELVEMIHKGEVSPMDVVNAISAKVKENGDFNLTEYVEGLKRLNVRQANKQEAPVHEQLKDRSSEQVSVSEVKAAKRKTETYGEDKKSRIGKINAVLDDVKSGALRI